MSAPEKPVVLVTGANGGIGRHVAAQLARRGAMVLLAARNPDRGAAAAAELTAEGLAVDPVTLDVTDDDSIAAAADYVTSTHGRLDVLINNAAIGGDSSPPTTSSRAAILRTMDTNVAGVLATTNAFLPLLRAAASPRIVNVSSELGSVRLVSDPEWPFSAVNSASYQASKAALDMLTVLYAKELGDTGFTVISVGPGYRATNLSTSGPADGAGDPAEGAAAIVALALADAVQSGVFFDDQGAVVAW